MKTIKAPVHTFDISAGQSPLALRKYCVITMNYGMLREKFHAYEYDVKTGEGEQRGQVNPAIRKLKTAIQNFTYTPTVINATLLPEHIKSINKDEVEIEFTDKPIPLTDGFQRFSAFESIREETQYQRVVDNLPVTVQVSLDVDKRKQDFVNFNRGTPVHRSHLLQLNIDLGLVNNEHLPVMKKARELMVLLNDNPELPFDDKIQFDQTTNAPIAAHVLMSAKRTDQLTNLFGTIRVAEALKIDNKEVAEIMRIVYTILDKKTKLFAEGGLFEFPPEGTKTAPALFIGAFNQVLYYLHLTGKKKIGKYEEKLIAESAKVFEQQLDPGLNTKVVKSTYMHLFAEKLFEKFLEDSEIIAGHFGIPTTLGDYFSYASFGVDSPGVPLTRVENKISAEPTTKQDTDTDPLFVED